MTWEFTPSIKRQELYICNTNDEFSNPDGSPEYPYRNLSIIASKCPQIAAASGLDSVFIPKFKLAAGTYEGFETSLAVVLEGIDPVVTEIDSAITINASGILSLANIGISDDLVAEEDALTVILNNIMVDTDNFTFDLVGNFKLLRGVIDATTNEISAANITIEDSEFVNTLTISMPDDGTANIKNSVISALAISTPAEGEAITINLFNCFISTALDVPARVTINARNVVLENGTDTVTGTLNDLGITDLST